MVSNDQQTMQIETVQEKGNPLAVKVEEIPLPPVDQWEALDNSGDTKAAGAGKSAIAQREIEKLDFECPPLEVVPLEYPFSHHMLGRVTQITIRRLTVGEVGKVLDQRPADTPDMFDIYAVMTDIPASILRGLVDIDGEKVAGACFNFLPRLFRPDPTDR